MNLSKPELLSRIAQKTNQPKTVVASIVDATIDTAREALLNGDGIYLPHLGQITLKTNSARVARNPQTGDTINVPESKGVKFKIAKDFKEELNRK